MSTKTRPREPLETLKTYPAFQVLRDNAETHQLEFRPKESLRLQNQGKLEPLASTSNLATYTQRSTSVR